MGTVTEIRAGAGHSEKITLNLGHVDLGHVDLLIAEGFYSNRADFLRTAVRNQIERHLETVERHLAENRRDLGLKHFSREQLEAVRASQRMIDINVLGLASIAEDVTPELACATIRSLSVLGSLHASASVKTALADRVR